MSEATDATKDATRAAFEAARAAMGATAAPPVGVVVDATAHPSPAAAPTPTPPARDEATGNRWRARNRRRREKGLPPYTEQEQRDLDAKAGFGKPAAIPGAPPSPGALPARVTRDGLEAENAQLKAQLAGYRDADLARATGATFGMAWDVARRFFPREDRPLSDAETAELGKLWAPVLGPRLDKVAHAWPIAAAVAGTYQVLAPHVAAALEKPPADRPRVASDAVEPAAPKAGEPAAVVVPEKKAPPIENEGYTFDMGKGD